MSRLNESFRQEMGSLVNYFGEKKTVLSAEDCAKYCGITVGSARTMLGVGELGITMGSLALKLCRLLDDKAGKAASMTVEEKLEVVKDRLNGMSFAEIEKKYNVSRRDVLEMLGIVEARRANSHVENSVYPVLSAWIYKHVGSVGVFAGQIGVHRQSVANWLSGKADLSKRHIDKILEITGMNYEELFHKRLEE